MRTSPWATVDFYESTTGWPLNETIPGELQKWAELRRSVTAGVHDVAMMDRAEVQRVKAQYLANIDGEQDQRWRAIEALAGLLDGLSADVIRPRETSRQH